MTQQNQGEIIIYQTEDGQSSLEVHLAEETVWLTLNQIAGLFDRDKSVVSRHLRNIFQSGELSKDSVVAKNATTVADGKTYQVDYYNLDAIISVGYRVNSIRGTQFRIWASSVLKEHIIKGYSTNERRLAEKGLSEMEQAVALLSRTLQSHELVTAEGKAVLEVVSRYAKSWSLLLQYDEDRLEVPERRQPSKSVIDYEQATRAIATMKNDLLDRGEAGDLFGRERDCNLQGILGNLY
ncbi:virulence RhuM family protein [Thermodesulfobacteriota bacterium]